MLDIHMFRDEESRNKIKESEKNRFKDISVVERIYELDKERVKANYDVDAINKEINKIQTQLKNFYKSEDKNNKELAESLQKLKIDPENKKELLKTKAIQLKHEIDSLMLTVGNILDPVVPIHKNDDGNVVVTTHEGFRPKEADYSNKLGYADIMKGFTNAKAGAEIVGHRGFYLQGKFALLARALKNYAIDFLVEKGYDYIQTPVFMKKEVMALTSQLSDFDEQLYKVEDDLYLIATSEQPMTALYMNKKLSVELPKLFAGDSLCFRKEAGAYGKDNAGIFRVHQFDKIEQFVICAPEESVKYHESMIKVSEEFFKTLGLSYQVVLISSGEMNDAAAKKYDLEAWFPNAGKFRELVSCSNCTDYQSRNLNVEHGFPKDGERSSYVHMLNGTLCAVQRSLCCIVENYQNDNCVIVPEVLRPYTRFDRIEF